jgi:hypothetical protein
LIDASGCALSYTKGAGVATPRTKDALSVCSRPHNFLTRRKGAIVDTGYIKIFRKLHNSNMWASEPFSRPQAWVDLIMLANWKDGFIRVAGQRVDILRGQCGWSEIRLAERWKWSRDKTRTFLKELVNDKQITKKTQMSKNVKMTKNDKQ